MCNFRTAECIFIEFDTGKFAKLDSCNDHVHSQHVVICFPVSHVYAVPVILDCDAVARVWGNQKPSGAPNLYTGHCVAQHHVVCCRQCNNHGNESVIPVTHDIYREIVVKYLQKCNLYWEQFYLHYILCKHFHNGIQISVQCIVFRSTLFWIKPCRKKSYAVQRLGRQSPDYYEARHRHPILWYSGSMPTSKSGGPGFYSVMGFSAIFYHCMHILYKVWQFNSWNGRVVPRTCGKLGRIMWLHVWSYLCYCLKSYENKIASNWEMVVE